MSDALSTACGQILNENGYSMTDMLGMMDDTLRDLKRAKPLSYDDFVESINLDLENCISSTEGGKQHHHSTSEDGFTHELKIQLEKYYAFVAPEVEHGGHCDLYIQQKGKNGLVYRWFAEAKLWGGTSYCSGALKQALGSYATGNENANKAAVLLYMRKKESSTSLMKKWQKQLEDDGHSVTDTSNNGLRFNSNHNLQGDGPEFTLRHYGISVYHQPSRDAEAKKIKKMRKEMRAKIEATIKAKARTSK
ncbi:hypothetical protein HWV00_21350 (plasmid) [Moritella sp. 24]|uniref:hypothetical protein n=1 Tax=Moritella sp. 24 TaxID=2746230 RepID=UPI001BA44C96|nr:hypothetical protein [Moritella sp. 24]QUM78822.1 hypothetical protein HWV00_21350 [Moritella sp. 24]